MDYKDGSYYGNDIAISSTYNCLLWMSVFIGETLPKFLIILGLSFRVYLYFGVAF